MQTRNPITVFGVPGAPALPAEIQIGVITNGAEDFPAFNSAQSGICQIQRSVARSRMSSWIATGAAAAPSPVGGTALTVVGTATARVTATTSRTTRAKRTGFVSGTVAGNVCGVYAPAADWTIADGTSGGFTATFIFAPASAAALATSRYFVGMSSNVAAPTNVDPAGLLNSIGVAMVASKANLQLVYGGSAAQTAIDLGANFPADALSTALYELIICASDNGSVSWQVTRIDTNVVATGSITNTTPGTTLPLSTTLLAPRAWRTNNATAQAMGLDIAAIYIEGAF